MRRWFCLALAAALCIGASPAQARSLDDYYYEDNQSTYRNNESYDEYYPNGVILDDSGVIHTSGGSVRMTVGETLNLAAGRIYHSLDEDLAIQSGPKTWASKDSAVVAVDAAGTATAHKTGSTRITVSWTDNRGFRVTQTVRVTVSPAGARTAVSGNSMELAEGKRVWLGGMVFDLADGEAVSWTTSREKIAAVDADGLLTAGSIGSCTVTASYIDINGAQRTEHFAIRVTSMLLEDRERSIRLSIPAGRTVDLLLLFYPYSYNSSSFTRNVALTVSDSAVLRLDGHTVQALAAGSGTAILKEYNGNEVTASQKIQVVVG